MVQCYCTSDVEAAKDEIILHERQSMRIVGAAIQCIVLLYVDFVLCTCLLINFASEAGQDMSVLGHYTLQLIGVITQSFQDSGSDLSR